MCIRDRAQWPTPQNVTEVRAFVALASYYRRHIKSFAEIARPLHELTKKDVRFYWGSPQEKAFNKLKEALTSAPVLAMPLDEGQYYGFLHGCYPIYPVSDRSIRLDPIRLDAVT